MSDCNCSHHSESGFTAGLLLGLIAGAAASHYLMNTEEGQKVLENLKENAGDALKEVGENPALSEKISELQKVMDDARATINTTATKVAEVTEERDEKPDSQKKNFFQRFGRPLSK